MALTHKIDAQDTGSQARATTITLARGVVQTPVFMPVGTFATVKTLSARDLNALSAQIMLANTYHLLMRPGPEVFERMGGIHGLMSWSKPVLTDSGGFQIFCLSHQRKITEDGAVFRSYTDGKKILLSPEKSIETQQKINSDIMMALDECVPSTSSNSELKRAMDLTHRWALRSLAAHTKGHQNLFAIVQGGTNLDLRKMSADFLTQHPFDGFAVGGLAVGESKSEREDMTQAVTERLPTNKPRYLMGVGTPVDLLEAVRRGIDMFDCILPTKHAQQGNAYTWHGRLGLARTVYRFQQGPIEEGCVCEACSHYSRAYIHHLIKCQEPLGWRLIALHNINHYISLMFKCRRAILQGSFMGFYNRAIEALSATDTKNEGVSGICAPPPNQRANQQSNYC